MGAQEPSRGPADRVMEIRPLGPRDGPAIHATLLGDPEIARWYRPDGPFTMAECEEMVTRKVAHRAAHRFGWALGWDGAACVGWSVAQYCVIGGAAEVEIGWCVARLHQRRGLATRLGRHAITEVGGLGLSSIVAYTRTDNIASRGVMETLGMTHDRDVVHVGLPHVIYRLDLP
jgi:RimJ/RimL family protein N-acetyltransferase